MTVEELLDRISSYELSEWWALAEVEAEEEVDQQENPEEWANRAKERRRPPPGILVRVQEDEPDEVPEDDAAPE